ncbi:MAG: hypothetical protein OQL06_08940 [Gammaproteobacteria bacterium]|nr:hypothetical protein [Gammaproteobacteria bacterium]
MQPRTIAILIVVLPLFTVNAVYLISAYAGQVPWCIPYIEGCTSISRAARKSDAIFLFRGLMIVYAVLLIYYWRLVQLWLNELDHRFTLTALIIFIIGMTGAVFLILYVDFLGSTGAMYRFLRRYGVIVYFSFTPLAHMIMLNHLYNLKRLKPDIAISFSVLYYQLSIFMLILILGLTNVVMVYVGSKTFESESIVEWNYSLLLALLFSGSIFMWKDLRLHLVIK